MNILKGKACEDLGGRGHLHTSQAGGLGENYSQYFDLGISAWRERERVLVKEGSLEALP